MRLPTVRLLSVHFLTIIGMIASGAASLCSGATYTWDGSGANANWTTGANWQGASAPPNDDSADVIFTDAAFANGSVDLVPNLDVSYSIDSLSFAGGSAFTLSSANNYSLNIGSNGLSQSSTAAQTITLPVFLTANQIWSFAGGAGALNFSGNGQISNQGYTLTIGTPSASMLNGVPNTLNGNITGTGALVVNGAGTIILTGANTYTGGTTFAGGKLGVGSPGALGSSGTLSFAGGILQYDGTNSTDYSARFSTAANQNYNIEMTGQSVTFASALTSSGGGFTLSGTGTLTLTGANTYTGGTKINGGTLQIGAGGASGNLGGGNVADNASLVFDRTDSVSVSNIISGSGSLTQNGSGTVILNGANTYTGGTTFGAGTLRLGSASALGNGGTLSFNGGTLQYSSANTSDYSASFSAAANQAYSIDTNGQNIAFASALTSNGGGLTKSGAGTLTLTATNTYTGTTTINAGTLQVGSGSTSGSLGAGNVVDNSTLVFDRSDSVSVSNVISGSGGGLTMLGTGTVTLTGANSYKGGTTISAGTLQIGNGATSGNLGGGIVADNASIVFDRSDSISVSNVISGSGSVTQNGSGTVTLTGANTYTGGTTFGAGTLKLGSAGALGTGGTLSFTGGTLQYSSSNTTDYSANFSTAANQAYNINTNGQSVTFANGLTSNGGSLTKLGGGILTLTSASTYTGGTIVSGGTLMVDNISGSATGSGAVQINSGNLGGGGFIAGPTTLATGSKLALDASPVQLTLNNNLSLNSGATLGIALGGLAAGSQYSQIRLTGSLTLGGNLSVSLVNGFALAVGQTFFIVDNTGTTQTSGTFGNATGNNIYTDASGDTFAINYSDNADGGTVANDVSLTVIGVVPEPGTLILMPVELMLLVVAIINRRRPQRNY